MFILRRLLLATLFLFGLLALTSAVSMDEVKRVLTSSISQEAGGY